MTSTVWRHWLRTVLGEKPARRPSSGRPRRRVLGLEAFEERSLPSGTPTVLDINPGPAASGPSLVAVGATTYFAADDGVHGRELWKSDGTAAGTVIVKDINPGPAASGPSWLTDVNGTLFFAAYDGTRGVELWKSDGTAAGTVLVKDIRPGSVSPYHSYISGLTAVNGTLFFAARDDTHGVELWKSDGTTAGTVLVKDLNTVSGTDWNGNSYPQWLTNVSGTLFFTVQDDRNAKDLWKSDGTAAGTVLVKDLNTVSWKIAALTAVNGTLFFMGPDVSTEGLDLGTELWKSDGTAAGTVIVKDLAPTYPGGSPGNLTAVDGTLFFTADDRTHGRELWKSDGTAAGTVIVKDLAPTYPGGSPGNLTAVDGTLFFTADDQTHGRELWRSDGTAAGTVRVTDINSASIEGGLTYLNGTLFFTAYDEAHGTELWRSDGTVSGTTLVQDIHPGSSMRYYGGYWSGYDYIPPWSRLVVNSSNPSQLTSVNGTLLFTADDGIHGTELWVLPAGPPAPPSLTITDVSRTEGNAGTSTALFTVQLSAASSETITVRYTTADGSATAGSDYQAASGVLTFAPGERTKTIPVLINGDSLVEPNETFVIDLGEATNATVFDGRGIGTIVDDEPRISIGDVSRSEGNTGQTAFTFTVSLSAAAGVAVTVDFTTAGVSATAGSDYQAASGRLTFAPGETTKTITVLVNGDRVPEPSETFVVNLGGSTNAIILDGQGIGTILDDEPRINISDVSQKEGRKSRTTLFTFTVTLDRAYDQSVTVSFRTADGTARVSDGDYVARTGTLTFAPGETSKTITIEVKGDSKREDYETFYVDLFNLSGNTLFTKSRGDGVILNDD